MTAGELRATPRRRADDRSGWDAAHARERTVHVADLDIAISSLRQAVDEIDATLGDGQPHLVVTVNVDQTLHARDSASVRQAYREAKLRFADGAPVVVLAKMLGAQLPGRVTGADLVPALCSFAARNDRRVAMIGGRPGVGARAASELQAAYPGLQVVLVESPPMGFDQDPEQNAQLVRRLRRAQPDYVFVALGAPRQEMWVHAHRHQLPAAAYVGVGGSLDFIAGVTQRAPQLWQRLGLEWLHRLTHDWRRLWRRYLVNDVRFLGIVAGDLRRRRRTQAAHDDAASADVLAFTPSSPVSSRSTSSRRRDAG